MLKLTNKIKAITLFLLFIPIIAKAIPALQKQAVQTFINSMVKKYHFNRHYLENLFANVNIEPIKYTTHIKAMPWHLYRQRFITPKRIKDGVQFWQQHAKILAISAKKYGLPESIIVAILGVESNYGQNQGEKPVIDTLASLGFANHYYRAAFFRDELVHFLLLCREQKLSPLAIKGSRSGAIGQSQFMPSSYRHYGIDFYGNGRVDLIHNQADAIASIANYLHRNGWMTAQTVAVPAVLSQAATHRKLPATTFKPTYRVAELHRLGIIAKKPLSKDTKVNFISLRDHNKMEYWLGLNNFYVITRYNHSTFYAMVVFELSKIIAKHYHHNRHYHKKQQAVNNIRK